MMERGAPPNPNVWFGERHKQMILLASGLLVSFMQKNLLAIALVAMANPTSDKYPTISYSTFQKGVLVSAVYYGFIAGSVPMGILNTKFGPTKVLAIGAGVLLGLSTACLPLVAVYLGFECMYAARVIQGFMVACTMPCSHELISNWIPSHEREKFTWTFAGTQCGPMLSSLVGIFAATPGGWPSVYYISGAMGVIWGIVSLIIGVDSPAEHKTISGEEKNFIEFYRKNSQSDHRKLSAVPWLAILTSLPVWAAALSQSAEMSGLSFMNNFFSSFLQGVYGFDIAANGVLSALPGLASFMCAFLFAYLGNLLRVRTSLNFSRKFWNAIALFLPAILLVVLVIWEPGAGGSVSFMVLILACTGGATNGSMTNTIDLSPYWAGVLISITFVPSNLAAIMSTTFSGYAINDEHNVGDWQRVFLIQATVFFVGGLIFQIFGSTKIQPWNDVTIQEKEVQVKVTDAKLQ